MVKTGIGISILQEAGPHVPCAAGRSWISLFASETRFGCGEFIFQIKTSSFYPQQQRGRNSMLRVASCTLQVPLASRAWVIYPVWEDTHMPSGTSSLRWSWMLSLRKNSREHVLFRRKTCSWASNYLPLKHILDLFAKTLTSALCLHHHAWLHSICNRSLKLLLRIFTLRVKGYSAQPWMLLQDMDKNIKTSRILGVTSSLKQSKHKQWHHWSKYPSPISLPYQPWHPRPYSGSKSTLTGKQKFSSPSPQNSRTKV